MTVGAEFARSRLRIERELDRPRALHITRLLGEHIPWTPLADEICSTRVPLVRELSKRLLEALHKQSSRLSHGGKSVLFEMMQFAC